MNPVNETLAEAFVQMRQNLYRYLRKRLPDTAPVDDLLQDIFVKAVTSLQSGRQVRHLGGWLYAAAHTTVVDYYRARGVETEAIDSELALRDEMELPYNLCRRID